MLNLSELQEEIKLVLDSVHARVYLQIAPVGATYPYLVFDIPNSFDYGESEVFVLDVDGWDNAEDTGVLDTLMASMDTALNKYTAEVQGSGIAVFRDTRLSIIDEDKKIKRRKYVYKLIAI